ncbi:hypothetical protein KSS87_006099 [Heliosperma pusillum]|nr:hypothetical protein KSS87_006099 [Heliosperma pusillum]
MKMSSKDRYLMEMGLKKQRKWVVFVILLVMTVSLNLVSSEAVTLSSSSIKPGRRQLQTQDTGNDIARVDPLEHFRKYRGPYNITNKHYWSSTIFSGIYGYAIGGLWLLIGVIYMVYLSAKSCCFGTKKGKLKKSKPEKMKCHLFLRTIAIVFAVLAIVASGIALAGSAGFQSRTKTILTIITNTADQASSSMYNATGAMRKISVILKQSDNIDAGQAANFLASSSDKLSYAASGIKRQAQTNRHLAGKVLTIMYILTSTTIGLSIGFATALTDNNSLSIILPCNELRSVGTVLRDVSTGLFEVINQVNSEISTLRANSLPGLKYVCNPFSGPPEFRYQPKDCPADSIPIGDFPKELKMVTCSDTIGTICKEGFISISEYKVIEAYPRSLLQAIKEAHKDDICIDAVAFNSDDHLGLDMDKYHPS